jgi:hypothetical protein
MDQITRQYIIFSATIAAGISFVFNFLIIELVRGTPLYGFPLGLGETVGFINLLFKFTNTVIVAAALTVPVYYALMWLQRRR